jgi:hypothetical protein
MSRTLNFVADYGTEVLYATRACMNDYNQARATAALASKFGPALGAIIFDARHDYTSDRCGVNNIESLIVVRRKA